MEVRAQQECLTPTFGTVGGSTNLSDAIASTFLLNQQQSAVTPQYIVFAGNLVIDIDYEFAPGSSIQIVDNAGPGLNTTSSIDVKGGVSFKIGAGSLVEGCLNMWEGIIGFKGARLDIQGVTIRDAVIGVSMVQRNLPLSNPVSTPSQIILKNCTFSKCYYGASFGDNPFSPSFSSPLILTVATGGIKENSFDGTGPLKPGAALAIPIPNPILGIRIQNVMPITILSNKIENFSDDAGIYIENASPLIVGCQFANIGTTVNLPDFSPAISIYNNPAERVRVWSCAFNKVSYAVQSTRASSVEVTGCKISNVVVGVCIQHVFINPNTSLVSFSITGCNISNFRDIAIRIGLEGSENIRSVRIQSNTITDNEIKCVSTLFGGTRMGISLDSPLPKNLNATVSNNKYFNLNKSFCNVYRSAFIDFKNVSMAFVSENELSDEENIGAFDINRIDGISLSGCDQLVVEENKLFGTATALSATNKLSRGIFASESGESQFTCNDLNNLDEGIVFDGANCDDSEIKTNIFGNHGTGLNLSTGATIVGLQFANENRWPGTMATEGNFNMSGVGINDIQNQVNMSRFAINNNTNTSVFWANPRAVGNGGDVFNWFTNSSVLIPGLANIAFIGDNAPQSCIATKDGGLDELRPGKRLSYADNLTLTDAFPKYMGFDASKQDAEFRLYDQLDRETALLAPVGSPAKTFLDTKASTSLGTLHAAWQVATRNSDPAAQVPANVKALADDLDATYTLISGLDALILQTNNTPAQTQQWTNDRESAIMTLDTKHTALNTASDAATASYVQLCSTHLNAVNALSVSDVWSTNMKTVLATVLGIQTTGTTPSAAQSAQLLAIAQQCRHSGGIAVSMARSLVVAYPNGLTLPSEEAYAAIDNTCPAAGGERTERDIENSAQVSLQPNPAGDYTTVDFGIVPTDGRIVVTDLSGKVVFNTTITDRTYRLSTASWVDGLYFVQVSNGQQPPKAYKLVVLHR